MDRKAKTITILGIGNILYADEGIGMHCMPILEDYYKNAADVNVHYGATDGMMLLSVVEDTEYLLIVDAINANKQPGTIIKLVNEEIPQYVGIKMSIHQIGFSEVLAAAKFRECLPAEMVMIGMQPFSLSLRAEITNEAQNKTPHLLACIKKQVEKWQANIRQEGRLGEVKLDA